MVRWTIGGVCPREVQNARGPGWDSGSSLTRHLPSLLARTSAACQVRCQREGREKESIADAFVGVPGALELADVDDLADAFWYTPSPPYLSMQSIKE